MSGLKYTAREDVASLLRQGKMEEALISCDRALSHNPEDETILNQKAIALIGLSRFEESLVFSRKAAGLNPGSPEIWVNLGVALDKLDRRKEAIEALRRAIRLAPYNTYARALLAILYQKSGDTDCAEIQNRKLQELVFPKEYAGFYFVLAAFLLGFLLGGVHSVSTLPEPVSLAAQISLVLLLLALWGIYLRSRRILSEARWNPFAAIPGTVRRKDHARSPYTMLGALAFFFVLGAVFGILVWNYYH